MNTNNVNNQSTHAPSFLHLKNGRKIAYSAQAGEGPTVIFLSGFKSDMTGSKALALEAFCKARSRAFIRFDYSGHGQSSEDFRAGSIGDWLADTLEIIDQLGSDKNILVGSSMGGWLMLLAALARPQKINALLGIAAAPDFTEALMWKQMTEEQRTTMARDGEILYPSCYGEEPYPITQRLIEEGRDHLLLNAPIAIGVPVRLIHGLIDNDVPWQTALTLCEKLQSPDVHIQFIKNAGHRLSEPNELKIITQTLADLL